jgi:hypothetical protein
MVAETTSIIYGRHPYHMNRLIVNIIMNIFIVIIIWSLAYGCGNNEIDATKNAGKSITITVTMRMGRCHAGRIAR